MTGESEKDRLARQYGLEVETVGDLLSETGGENHDADPAAGGGAPHEAAASSTPFQMPVIDGYPVEWPGEGIFFGMSDDHYHAIPAFNATGAKKQAASPTSYWAFTPWLNAEFAEFKREQEEKREASSAEHHFDVGHGYHARILEGQETFHSRFAVKLDRKDYPNALVTIDDIKAAFPDGIKPRGKTKAEIFEHLKTLDATVELWDHLVAEHAEANKGKCLIAFHTFKQIELAAAMIEKHPELGPAVRSGQPEVVLCWVCQTTGVPMKARLDLMKVKTIVDLKTVQNSKEQSIENVIRYDIASRRYAVPVSVYVEAAREVRRIVREHGASAVFSAELADGEEMTLEAQECHHQRVQWALKWAQHQKRDEFLFVYIQKGMAPIVRGLFFPMGGTTMMLANDIVTMTKKRLRQFAEEFGTDAWVDAKPIYDLADEDLPNWSTEI